MGTKNNPGAFPIPTEPGFYWVLWKDQKPAIPFIAEVYLNLDGELNVKVGSLFGRAVNSKFIWLSGPLHPPGSEWQPIATAPKDRPVQVYVPNRRDLPAYQCTAQWHPAGDWSCGPRRATHWHELLPPPAVS